MSKRLQNRISRISSRKSAENFLSQKSAKKNSASRILAEKMYQSEFGHKKIRLWGIVSVDTLRYGDVIGFRLCALYCNERLHPTAQP